MSQLSLSKTTLSPRHLLSSGGILLAVLLGMVRWGTPPPVDTFPLYVLGVIVLISCLCGFAWVTWHLLLRPLPLGHKTPDLALPTVRFRQGLSALIICTALILVISGFWDEVWHRIYGVPFGEDFFWRPHLLMYLSFLIVIVLAFISFVIMLQQGKGSMQQRFRANPTMGLLVLLGSFFLFALPADPLWHALYGDDISAWSLPHALIWFSFSAVMILAIAVQASTFPTQPWRSLWRLPSANWLQHLVIIFAIALTSLFSLQILTTEWDSPTTNLLQARPDWLLPFVLVGFAAFQGTLVNQTTRVIGLATLTGLIALGIRALLLALFDFREISTSAWIAVLPSLVAIDLGYALQRRMKRSLPDWLISGLAATIGLGGTTPFFNIFFPYPQITTANSGLMLLMGLLAALAASWVGYSLGDYFATTNKQVIEAETPRIAYWALLSPAALILTLSFVVFYIVTANPPV